MSAPRNINIVTKMDKTELQSRLFEDLELLQDACDQLAILEGDNVNGPHDRVNRESAKVRDRLVSAIAQRKLQLSEENSEFMEFCNASDESPGIGSYNVYTDTGG
jgi:hypothetical protein